MTEKSFEKIFSQNLFSVLVNARRKNEERRHFSNFNGKILPMSKNIFLFAIIYHLGASYTYGQVKQIKHKVIYPTNFDVISLDKAKKDSSFWRKKIIAFNGRIIRIDTSNKTRHLIKIELGSDNVVWIEVKQHGKFEFLENKIRVIGYILPTDLQSDDITAQFSIMVISFAVLELKTKKMYSHPSFKKQVDDWQNGKIPTLE